MTPELVGRVAGMLVCASPALYFLFKGFGSRPHSRRLANFALFCGLTAFVMPEAIFGWVNVGRSGLLFTAGAARILFGAAGLLLALMAFRSRRDGGVGLVRPLAGAGFSLLHLLAGVALLLYGSFLGSSTPWVYESPDGAFGLTLPSQQWKQAPSASGEGVVAFVRRGLPRMQAKVVSVKRQKTKADFDAAVESWRVYVEKDPERRGKASYRKGTNLAGNTYSYCTLMDAGPDGTPVFVAHSVVWCPDKHLVVEMIFEGLPMMHSEAGKAAEMEAVEKSAETICCSVE